MDELKDVIFKEEQIDEGEFKKILKRVNLSEDDEMNFHDFDDMIRNLLFAQMHKN